MKNTLSFRFIRSEHPIRTCVILLCLLSAIHHFNSCLLAWNDTQFGKILDAVKDPFIGAFINKSKWSLANYLWYLPLPTAVITVLCFTMKIYSDGNSTLQNATIIIYGFVVFFLWEIIFSFGDIPMISYPNVLCREERERTKLLSLRPVGTMVCSICCLIVQPLAFAVSGALGGTQTDERNSFFIIALIFSIVGYIFIS